MNPFIILLIGFGIWWYVTQRANDSTNIDQAAQNAHQSTLNHLNAIRTRTGATHIILGGTHWSWYAPEWRIGNNGTKPYYSNTPGHPDGF